VLRREAPLMIHCERKSDILAALRLGDEFEIDVILAGCADAWKVIPELSRRDVPVILDQVYRRQENTEDRDFDPRTPALLAEAGVRVAFQPEDGGLWLHPALAWGGGDLLELAALAVQSGMDPDAALRAVTIEPARMIGMGDRLGSLEPGKDADLVILSGHPLLVRSLPDAVFIDGRLVYRKTRGEHL
jgi:imidazolonepropionase-like amidohydrolase